jgi:hypothetical protein
MNEIRAIGMVIYTYERLEERLDPLWDWLHRVEQWANRSYAEFNFASRARESLRVWKATSQNREKLYQRLQTEQPWSEILFGWPRGALRDETILKQGLFVAIKSRPQPERGMESYRTPSYVYLQAHPDVIQASTGGVEGFVRLGMAAWEIVEGVYGFIDVETGIPLQDDIFRNAIHLFDSTVPPEYHREFRAWQELMPKLDKRVWKAFWGNFLGAEHLRQLGGIQELRRADPLYQLRPEYLAQAYQQGKELLRASKSYVGWYELAGGGVLLTLSASPLEWFEKEVQERRERLQAVLAPIALSVTPEE